MMEDGEKVSAASLLSLLPWLSLAVTSDWESNPGLLRSRAKHYLGATMWCIRLRMQRQRQELSSRALLEKQGKSIQRNGKNKK
jgi:hypothetical protein